MLKKVQLQKYHHKTLLQVSFAEYFFLFLFFLP